MRVAFGLAAGALLLASSATAFAQAPGASADLKTPSGETVGTATFTQEVGRRPSQGPVQGAAARDRTASTSTRSGKCDAPDFMTAGGHYNPTSKQHGLNNPQGAARRRHAEPDGRR